MSAVRLLKTGTQSSSIRHPKNGKLRLAQQTLESDSAKVGQDTVALTSPANGDAHGFEERQVYRNGDTAALLDRIIRDKAFSFLTREEEQDLGWKVQSYWKTLGKEARQLPQCVREMLPKIRWMVVRSENAPRKGKWRTWPSLRDYYSEVEERLAHQPNERKRAKFIKAKDEFFAARNRLIQCNLRLVFAVVKKNLNKGLSFDDLVGKGMEGLLRAAETFATAYGTKFSTHATHWIKQAISGALRDLCRTVRVPRAMWDMNLKLKEELGKRYSMEGNPSQIEVEEAIKMLFPNARLDTRRWLLASNVSKETLLVSDEDGNGESWIPDTRGEPPDEPMMRATTQEAVQASLEILSPRERAVIDLRFGLHGDDPLTLLKIGKILGLTRERIRQIEVEALNKLRQGKIGALLEDHL